MLEIVILFLLSSVTFFLAHLERPTTFWGNFYTTCPILMGLLSAGLVYINVGFSACNKYTKYLHFILYRNRYRLLLLSNKKPHVPLNYLKKMTLFRLSVQIKM